MHRAGDDTEHCKPRWFGPPRRVRLHLQVLRLRRRIRSWKNSSLSVSSQTKPVVCLPSAAAFPGPVSRSAPGHVLTSRLGTRTVDRTGRPLWGGGPSGDRSKQLRPQAFGEEGLLERGFGVHGSSGGRLGSSGASTVSGSSVRSAGDGFFGVAPSKSVEGPQALPRKPVMLNGFNSLGHPWIFIVCTQREKCRVLHCCWTEHILGDVWLRIFVLSCPVSSWVKQASTRLAKAACSMQQVFRQQGAVRPIFLPL